MGEMALRVDVLGEEEHAARFLVEAMDDAETRVGGSSTRQSQLFRERFQNAVVLASSRDRRQSCGLADGDDVGVVVEDGEFGGQG